MAAAAATHTDPGEPVTTTVTAGTVVVVRVRRYQRRDRVGAVMTTGMVVGAANGAWTILLRPRTNGRRFGTVGIDGTYAAKTMVGGGVTDGCRLRRASARRLVDGIGGTYVTATVIVAGGGGVARPRRNNGLTRRGTTTVGTYGGMTTPTVCVSGIWTGARRRHKPVGPRLRYVNGGGVETTTATV